MALESLKSTLTNVYGDLPNGAQTFASALADEVKITVLSGPMESIKTKTEFLELIGKLYSALEKVTHDFDREVSEPKRAAVLLKMVELRYKNGTVINNHWVHFTVETNGAGLISDMMMIMNIATAQAAVQQAQ